MIMKILIAALTSKGVQGDVRSDSEGEDEAPQEKKHKKN